MRQLIRNWKDCTDPRKVETFAKEKGIEIRNGKGDHKVMSYRGRSETYYTGRELSIGVARSVWKFFLNAGLLCLVIVMVVHSVV